MKILFIGGTGNISTASTKRASEQGMEVFLLNRGRGKTLPRGVQSLTADINDAPAVARVLEGHSFDAVVNWIAFSAKDVARDIALFRGKTRQYIYISSASVYQKPPASYLIREETPRVNPFWDYSQNKIAGEECLLQAVRDEGFPGVIVRPSLTYGDTLIPLVINSWDKSYTVIDRMRQGKQVIVPGDGTSLWTITHNSDFAKGLVGLLGQEQAMGEAFHITSDEVLSWDQIYTIAATAAGVEPKIVHLPSDFIALCQPWEKGSLHGDKSQSAVFDNSKIKTFVPGFCATTTWAEGVQQTLRWFQEDPTRQQIDDGANAAYDKMIAAYEQGVAAARKEFAL